MEASTGHIGLSVSSKSHAELWPNVAEWFAERSVLDDVEDAADATDADESEAVDIEIDGPDEDDDEDETFDDTDLDQVRGVGPAYAERLREAGVETVSDLAAADPEDLAERIDVGVSRVADWVDHAGELTS